MEEKTSKKQRFSFVLEGILKKEKPEGQHSHKTLDLPPVQPSRCPGQDDAELTGVANECLAQLKAHGKGGSPGPTFSGREPETG